MSIYLYYIGMYVQYVHTIMNRYYPSFGNNILYKYIFYYFNNILHYKFKRLLLNTKIYYIPSFGHVLQLRRF